MGLVLHFYLTFVDNSLHWCWWRHSIGFLSVGPSVGSGWRSMAASLQSPVSPPSRLGRAHSRHGRRCLARPALLTRLSRPLAPWCDTRYTISTVCQQFVWLNLFGKKEVNSPSIVVLTSGLKYKLPYSFSGINQSVLCKKLNDCAEESDLDLW